MNNNVDMSTEQRNIEKSQLWINSIFFVCVGIMSTWMHKIPLLAVLCVLALGSSWYMVMQNKMDYHRRVFATVLFMHVIFVILFFVKPHMSLFYVTYIAMIVTSGVYGIKEIILIPAISNTLFLLGQLLMWHGYDEGLSKYIIQHIIPFFVIYFIDYTLYVWLKHREQSQNIMLQSFAILEKTERSKHGFLMNMSHEIRTPVHATCGVCESLQEEEDVDYIHNHLKFIGASGLWLVGILEDLIDYSVLQSKKISLDTLEYRTDEMIYTTANVCMAIRASKRIDMIFDVDATLPSSFFGDRNRVCRVIGGIVNNALKFTETGGVRLCITQSKDIGGVSLIITVTDTGCGIESKKLKSIQNTFRGNDKNPVPGEGGVGMGLLMTYYTVSAMGGNISIQSQVGKGTVVNVILPQKAMDEKPFVGQYHKKTICFIENDSLAGTQLSTAYEDMFSHMGAQLKTTFAYCNSMVQFQERLRVEDFENILVTAREYEEYKSYFDELAQWHQLVIAADFDERSYLHKNNMHMVMYPFHVASLVDAFLQQENQHTNTKEVSTCTGDIDFVTPEAKILVVDDNQMNLQVINQLLSVFQPKVCLVESGAEAISMVQKESFDMVFMDHMMPEMDGVETMRRIRGLSDVSYQRLPIIALTANIVGGIREEFISYGFDDFASKPINKATLKSLLQKYLPPEKCVNKTEEAAPQDDIANSDDNSLYIGALDTKLGITYCGGKEAYRVILEEYAKQGDINWKKIQELFDTQQWDKYTIEVHGIKSAMLTIGAKELSQQAKQLEQAGKDNDITYILNHHEAMVSLYRRILSDLQQYFGVEEDKAEVEVVEDMSALTPMTEDEVQQLLAEMEEKAFMLDGEGMKECAQKMINRSYGGKSLSSLREEYIRKVEREDYLSAWELAQKVFGLS